MRVLKTIIISLSALMFISCGNNFSMIKHHSKPSISPDTDSAILVIYRGTSFGYSITIDNYLDNTFIGQTKGFSYFVTKAPPGERYLTGIAEKNVRKKLNLEAGKIYYINQGIYPGFLLAESRITVSDARHFLKKLKDLNFYYYDKAAASQANASSKSSIFKVADIASIFDLQG